MLSACGRLQVLAEHITDLSQRAERVVMLDARNAELEKLMLEAAAAREALSCEVSRLICILCCAGPRIRH